MRQDSTPILFLCASFVRMEGFEPPQGSLFPHREMRRGQRDFYNDAKSAAAGGKILFANAPTGIGKTAAALCAALEEALPAGRKVVFLTHQNSHHIQAMIECRAINEKRKGALAMLRPALPKLRVVDKVSKHRMCLLRSRDPSDDSPFLLCEIAHCRHSRPKQIVVDSLLSDPISASESVKRSRAEEYCAHYAALAAMKDADVVVCDYSYLFEPGILGTFLMRLGRPLGECDVIIDEAHNLPARIMDMNEREIGEKTMKSALRALSDARKRAAQEPEVLARINSVAGYFRSTLAPALRSLAEASNAAGDERRLAGKELALFHPSAFAKRGLIGSLGVGDGETGALGEDRLSAALFSIAEFIRLEAIRGEEGGRGLDVDGLAMLVELASFLHSAEKAAEGSPAYGVFIRTSQDRELFRIRSCLFDPSIASRQVFSKVHSAVLMSGTLVGKQGICSLLGIDEGRAVGLGSGAYASPFPQENQWVRVCNWVSSRQRERLDAKRIKVMAAIIDEAARACAPHSLAIFYPSYEYLRMVKDELVLSGFRHETEIRGERQAAAEERKARVEARGFDEKPIVLHAVIGGAYSEGMDFRNNPFKLIVLAGFPYPKPDARHEAYEGYLAAKFASSTRASELASILPASIKTAQAIGRGIRKAEDWCYCLLIDDRFARYLPYYQSSLRAKAEVIDATDRKRIWEDVHKFISRMEKAY